MRPRFLTIVLLTVLLVAGLAYFFPKRPPSFHERGISVTEALGGGTLAGFARATEPRRFVFPADHGPHPAFRTEWWYFTGNLQTTQGRRFGYQLTFFRVALTPHPAARRSRWGTNEVFMAHFALTDVAGKRFHFAERFSRAALDLAGAGGKPLTILIEDWQARECSEKPWGMQVSACDGDVSADLDIRSLKPVVLNSERGLSRKGKAPGNASYYYSLTRLATAGTVRIGNEEFHVTGLSWLDREWSTSALEPDQVGWDWFALQLDDGRDVMFYRLRRRDGSADPFSSGTIVAADGSSSQLSAAAVQIETSDWWQSPTSGTRYPARWRFRIPEEQIDLEIVPRLAKQELLTSVHYWEGAVVATGREKGAAGGSGYVELTGYEVQAPAQ